MWHEKVLDKGRVFRKVRNAMKMDSVLIALGIVFFVSGMVMSARPKKAEVSSVAGNAKVESDHGFKMRVSPFTDIGNYYLVEWSNDGGRSWNRLNRMLDVGSEPSFGHPVLDGFESAVEMAKQFKSVDDVKMFNAAERAKYDLALKRREIELQEREKKIWVSE